MEQRECAGYIITQSIKVKDSEFVLGEHPKKDMYVTWRCKDGDNYFWGHYTSNRYEALKDLCWTVLQSRQSGCPLCAGGAEMACHYKAGFRHDFHGQVSVSQRCREDG